MNPGPPTRAELFEQIKQLELRSRELADVNARLNDALAEVTLARAKEVKDLRAELDLAHKTCAELRARLAGESGTIEA